MSQFQITSLDDLMSLVIRVTDVFQDDDLQYKIIQSLAYRLEEQFEIPRAELRALLDKFGFILEEFCIGCDEQFPSYNGIGDPICNQCRMDIDSVS